MFREMLDVTLEGKVTQRITTDQRDVAQLELTSWYGEKTAVLATLRHLAYTAMRRQGHIPEGTTWEEFNTRLCVHVDGVDEREGEEGEEGGTPTTTSGPGPRTTSGTRSSTSRSRPGSRSPDRRASKAGTPETSTP